MDTENSNLPGQLNSFVNYLKFERRFSLHTIRAYHDDLQQCYLFFQKEFEMGDCSVSQIAPAHIRTWLASMKEAKLTSKSINRKISTLKSFFKYCVKMQLIEQTPMTSIISPKLNKRLPVFVEEKDMSTLLEYVEFPDSWKGRTDKLAIHIFYNTGIRLSELLKLKESQVGMGSIKVTGKGNKERVIPISNGLVDMINEYIEGKKQLPIADRIYLLVNENGKTLYAKYLYLIVKKYLAQVTTLKKKSPHILRHSFATHLSNNGADLNSIKELLGHSSLAATQVYTHNTIEKLKEAYMKAHPKA